MHAAHVCMVLGRDQAACRVHPTLLTKQGFSAAARAWSSCTPVEALQIREEGRDPSTEKVPEVSVSCCLKVLALLQGCMGMPGQTDVKSLPVSCPKRKQPGISCSANSLRCASTSALEATGCCPQHVPGKRWVGKDNACPQLVSCCTPAGCFLNLQQKFLKDPMKCLHRAQTPHPTQAALAALRRTLKSRGILLMALLLGCCSASSL